MMIPFRALVRKDILLFFVDRRALLMSFAIPIAIGSFFGYVLGGAGDQDNASKIRGSGGGPGWSNISREIVRRWRRKGACGETLDAGRSPHGRAQRNRDRSRADSSEFRAGRRARVFLPRARNRRSSCSLIRHTPPSAAMVAGMLAGDVMQAVSKEMFSGQTGRLMARDSLARVEGSTAIPDADKKPLEDLLRSVDRWQGSSAAVPSRLACPCRSPRMKRR